VPLLGLPKENDWILYPPYSDKSLIRNVLTFDIASAMGRYASRTKFCELILNGDYHRIYVLMEKIKRDSTRVNIAKLPPEEISGDDLTGGYIIKIDKTTGETFGGWDSAVGNEIFYQYHYPKPDEIVSEQENYIQDFIESFERMMAGENYADPEHGYPSIIDIGSFVDYAIVNELTKNVDAYRISAFMYKDKDSRGGKLVMGPVWDHNRSLGNVDYYDGWITEGWHIEFDQFKPTDKNLPIWWSLIWQDTTFSTALSACWHTLRKDILSEARLSSTIDSIAILLSESQERNFNR